MTFALGLRGIGSFVIGADRLLSYNATGVSGAFGGYDDKIFTESSSFVSSVVTGAGDGALLRSAARNINRALSNADDSEPPDPSDPSDNGSPLSKRIDCKAIVEEELTAIFNKTGVIPDLSLLIAVRQDGFGVDFLRSDGLVVQPARDCEAFGIGENSLVHFLLDNLYQLGIRNKELVPLAALVLQMAKRYCPQYCGGPSDICVLRYDGYPTIRRVNKEAIAKMEGMFDSGIKPRMLELIEEIWSSFTKSDENPSLPTAH